MEWELFNKVGAKGQVVIEKKLRDRLGIGPGWMVFQQIVDGRLELRFFPPEHNRSLRGALASYTSVTVPPDRWHEAKEQALADAFAEEFDPGYNAR